MHFNLSGKLILIFYAAYARENHHARPCMCQCRSRLAVKLSARLNDPATRSTTNHRASGHPSSVCVVAPTQQVTSTPFVLVIRKVLWNVPK